MASLDEIFYKEFTQMMLKLKGLSGYQNLTDIALPPQASGRFLIEKHEKVAIANISDEFYSKLNNTEALLWNKGALNRRKFDHKGEFIKDKDGNYVLEDVVCPHECAAIISPVRLGVKNKYKAKEHFEYVDFVQKKDQSGNTMQRFVYIVPKKYLYKLNQTALVLSWNKLRVFYSGIALSLQNGHVLYMYIIPYKPSSVNHNYRVLHCKTSDDYSAEINMVKDFWISNNIMFNPEVCQLTDIVKGRDNMAYLRLDGVLDMYERFNANKPMSESEELEEVEFNDYS